MSVQAEDRVVIDPAVWEAMARDIERRDILGPTNLMGHHPRKIWKRPMDGLRVIYRPARRGRFAADCGNRFANGRTPLFEIANHQAVILTE